MHIGFRTAPFIYTFNDYQIMQVHSFKDLGVIIDDKLTFHEHINSISVSAHRLCAMTFRAFSLRNLNFLNKVFSIYIRPKLEYASTVWCPQTKGDVVKLERVLRLFTKRIPKLRELNYAARLSAMHMPSLVQRRQMIDTCQLHKIVHGQSALKLSDFHIAATTISTLRSAGKSLNYPTAHTSIRNNFFSHRAVRTWNNLPDSIPIKGRSAIKRHFEAIGLS